MQTYTIQINEGQRLLLLKAFAQEARTDVLSRTPGTGCGAYDTELEEFLCLKEMFVALPNDEAEMPGVLHGFCA